MSSDEEVKQIDENLEKIKSIRNKINERDYFIKENNCDRRDNSLDKLDSRLMKEPIIKKENFTRAISKCTNNQKLQFKLMDYAILKEIMEKCGSYPTKFRSYVWKYLLSLPGLTEQFDKFASKCLHPFYSNEIMENNFNVKEKRHFRKLQQICSMISFWCPEIGNIYFLPNLVFPFIKSFQGDDLFIFELLIAFFNTFAVYWFEYYPGGPLNHINLSKKIIEKEAPKLFNYLVNVSVDKDIPIEEYIWRLIKNNFSETLNRESWLQYMDFILTYSHKPEIILYFASSLILSLNTSSNELESFLFGGDVYKCNSNFNILNVFNKTLQLMRKYSKYQIYKYVPYIPENFYSSKIKFPLDFIETTKNLREILKRDQENLELKKTTTNEIERRYKDLMNKEQMMQKQYECLIHREKEKSELMNKELDLILYQKQKFNEEVKKRKLEKVDNLNKIIDSSINLYDKMHHTELKKFEDELRHNKLFNEFDLKSRLQQEELNNLEFEANRKMIQMLNLRGKDEEQRKLKITEDIRKKNQEVNNKLSEEKWRLEDETMAADLEKFRNLKEIELLRKKDKNNLLHKAYAEKLDFLEKNLLAQQVEQERARRALEKEFEINKILVDNQNLKREGLLHCLENNTLEQIAVEELGTFKNRKKENNEILSAKMKENLEYLSSEEKALIDFEQNLKKQEFDIKLNQIKKKADLRALEDEKYFQDQFLKLEELKRAHLIKKEEMEIRKQNISDNLNAMTMNSNHEMIHEQKENFEKFRSLYVEETNKQGLKPAMNKINSLDSNNNISSRNSIYDDNPRGNNLKQINHLLKNKNTFERIDKGSVSSSEENTNNYNLNTNIKTPFNPITSNSGYNPLSSSSNPINEEYLYSNKFSSASVADNINDTNDGYNYMNSNSNYYAKNFSDVDSPSNKGLNSLGSLSLSVSK